MAELYCDPNGRQILPPPVAATFAGVSRLRTLLTTAITIAVLGAAFVLGIAAARLVTDSSAVEEVAAAPIAPAVPKPPTDELAQLREQVAQLKQEMAERAKPVKKAAPPPAKRVPPVPAAARPAQPQPQPAPQAKAEAKAPPPVNEPAPAQRRAPLNNDADRLPDPPPPDEPNPPAAAAAAARARNDARLNLLKNIREERLHLLSRREELQAQLTSLQREQAAAEAEFNRLSAAAAAANLAFVRARQAGDALQQQRAFASDPVVIQQIDIELANLSAELRGLEQQYLVLAGRAEAAQIEAARLAGQQRKLQGRLNELYQQAERLREEWLPLMDPWGLLGRGETERALLTFTEWIVLDGESYEAYIARGFARLNLGNYAEAVDDFSKALEINDLALTVALAGRGRAYLETNQIDKAMKDFAQAIKMNKTFALIYLYRGRTLAQEKKYERAIKDFETARRLAPLDPAGFREGAWLLATCPQNRFRNGKKAVALAQTACKLGGPDDWRSALVWTAAYVEIGDFKAAEKIFADVLAIQPPEERAASLEVIRVLRAEKKAQLEN